MRAVARAGCLRCRAVSARARIAIVLVAVVGLVVAFVAASGGGDDSSDRPATAPTSAPTTETGSTQQAGTATTPAEPPVPLVTVVGGKPQGGVRKLVFDNGEQVRFRVRSDTADEVHVHGYDIEREVPAGGTVTFSFKGDIEGRFEVELHHSETQIASLEVRP